MGNNSFYQGGGPTLDTQNPTLIPNSYNPQTVNGVTSFVSPSDFIAANPRVAGSCVGTLGGSTTHLDIVSVTVTNNTLPGGAVTVSHTVGSTETIPELGENLAAAINTNSVLQQHEMYATSLNGTVTFLQNGSLAAFTTLSAYVSGADSETLSFANSGMLTGGSGPVVPMNNFSAQLGAANVKFLFGFPRLVAYPQLARLVADGAPLK